MQLGFGTTPGPLFASLKTRVKSILTNLELVNACMPAETESKSAVTFLETTKGVLDMMRAKNKPLSELLKKAGLSLTLDNVERILVTWMDSDLLNSEPSHLAVLWIGLSMAQDWLQTRCPEKLSKIAMKPLYELIFALQPYVHLEPMSTLMQLASILPSQLIQDDLEALKKAALESKTYKELQSPAPSLDMSPLSSSSSEESKKSSRKKGKH